MKLYNKLIGPALALALCAGLLAGCGSVAGQADPSEETTVETQQVEAEDPNIDETEAAGGPEEGDPGFDAPALLDALNDLCSIGPGAAGCSLRAAKAAGELVSFAALNWNDGTAQGITDAIGGWFEELDEESKEEFYLGWDMVEDTVSDIVDHPDAPETEELLSEAGLPNLGLAALDLTHTGDLMDAIRSQTGMVTENS